MDASWNLPCFPAVTEPPRQRSCSRSSPREATPSTLVMPGEPGYGLWPKGEPPAMSHSSSPVQAPAGSPQVLLLLCLKPSPAAGWLAAGVSEESTKLSADPGGQKHFPLSMPRKTVSPEPASIPLPSGKSLLSPQGCVCSRRESGTAMGERSTPPLTDRVTAADDAPLSCVCSRASTRLPPHLGHIAQSCNRSQTQRTGTTLTAPRSTHAEGALVTHNDDVHGLLTAPVI